MEGGSQRTLNLLIPEREPRRQQALGHHSLPPEQQLVGGGAEKGAQREGRDGEDGGAVEGAAEGVAGCG